MIGKAMEEKLGSWRWEPVTEAVHITVGQQAESRGQETGTGLNLQSPIAVAYFHSPGPLPLVTLTLAFEPVSLRVCSRL